MKRHVRLLAWLILAGCRGSVPSHENELRQAIPTQGFTGWLPAGTASMEEAGLRADCLYECQSYLVDAQETVRVRSFYRFWSNGRLVRDGVRMKAEGNLTAAHGDDLELGNIGVYSVADGVVYMELYETEFHPSCLKGLAWTFVRYKGVVQLNGDLLIYAKQVLGSKAWTAVEIKARKVHVGDMKRLPTW